jgi:antitoxin (DNA-binding transcriptional repressor) of toxin-antitoxin stability system
MSYVNMHDAKSRLSQLVDAIESGVEKEIVLARNGRPAALLVPVPKRKPIRMGLARGAFSLPDDFDADNEEIARLFHGDDDRDCCWTRISPSGSHLNRSGCRSGRTTSSSTLRTKSGAA